MNMTRLWQVIISQIAGIVVGLIIGVDGGDWGCCFEEGGGCARTARMGGCVPGC